MRWRWPRFWVDNFRGFNYGLTWQERRNLVLDRVERGGFGWWIVFVAGFGFMSDAYDIFAMNTIIPMLATVYWAGTLPTGFHFGVNVSTLLGTILGQVIFGILADMYGRRKMYGLELIATVVASLGLAASSSGVDNSMSLFGWLIFYRLLMGVSIGADYPLSGVITSEFAPTKHRARMVAAVFFFQSVGQVFATGLALAATALFRSHIPSNQDPSSCSVLSISSEGKDCARTVDRIWRLVSGIGAVPAALAIISRLTIPESVYWVLDVKNDSNTAMQTRDYWPEPLSAQSGRSVTGENVEAINQRLMGNGRDPSLGVPQAENTMMYEDPHPQEQSLSDFRKYLFGSREQGIEGNWTDLLATSVSWMSLDFTFYLLGVNSSRLIPDMFNTPVIQGPYQTLIGNEWHTIVATSIGAVLGGATAIYVMNKFSRKKLQMWGFIALAMFFGVEGILYITLLGKDGHEVIIVIYVFCQFFFNLGPNTTTFIIPAEAFPTRYRCTCHGISAAVGKLGSVLGQIVITLLVKNTIITHTKRVGILLITFIVVMAIGALITGYWVPETCDIFGKSRPLEQLALGKAAREELTREEKRQKTNFSMNNLRRRNPPDEAESA